MESFEKDNEGWMKKKKLWVCGIVW